MIACGSGSLHRALETGGTPRWDRAGGCDLARSDLLPASSSSKLPSPRCFMGIDVLDFSKPIVLIGTCASSIFPPPLLVESFRLINYFFPPDRCRPPSCPNSFESLFDARIVRLPMDQRNSHSARSVEIHPMRNDTRAPFSTDGS